MLSYGRFAFLASSKFISWCQKDSVTVIGCVRLAPLGRPPCVAFFFTRTNVGNYLHTLVLGKKNRHTPGSTQGS